VTAQTQEAGGVTTTLSLYDSEIIKVEGVLERLNERRVKTSRMSYEAFTDEAKNRFLEIGLVVSVRWYSAGVEQADGSMKEVEGTLIPEIVITGRTEKAFAFDHDQMSHEVQSDLLQLGTGGKLKLTAEDARKILEIKQGHKHGKGCGH
jgi:hypothetical protein